MYSIFLYIIIIIIILFAKANNNNKNIKDTTNSKTFKKVRQSVMPDSNQAITPINQVQTSVGNIKDNRENDWLAKQLRAEQASQEVISDMFQLKREHLNNCEADYIKREHANNCDAEQVKV